MRSGPPIARSPATGGEWRCVQCGQLLAVLREGRLHIRFARGHEYLVGFPATSKCRSCGSLNEVRDATSLGAAPAGHGR